MEKDICIQIDNCLINVRVGAIIVKNGHFLMVGSKNSNYLYSVGGRIKIGESAEEAVIREVYEETGITLKVDRMAFIHENFFNKHICGPKADFVYEIAFYFYMTIPEDFEPKSEYFIEQNAKEYLVWVPIGSDVKMFPSFLSGELANPSSTIKHFVTDDR